MDQWRNHGDDIRTHVTDTDALTHTLHIALGETRNGKPCMSPVVFDTKLKMQISLRQSLSLGLWIAAET